jgi:SAM-dependent methyltransferase
MSTDASWVESMPAIYDRCLGPTLFAPFASFIAQHAALLAPARVLELAAGTGIATRGLVDALPAADVVATDLNPAMVQWAAEHVSGPTWQTADAQQLSFTDNAFDLIVCQFGVMFFPDRPKAFAEAARVLVPGGTLMFTAWDTVDTSPLTAALVQSLTVLWPDDPPTFVVRVPHGYTDVSRIEDDLRAGGLLPESVERVVLQGTSPSARTLAEGFCYGSPLRFELEARGSLDELSATIADRMASILGEGPILGDLGAIVATAKAC